MGNSKPKRRTFLCIALKRQLSSIANTTEHIRNGCRKDKTTTKQCLEYVRAGEKMYNEAKANFEKICAKH